MSATLVQPSTAAITSTAAVVGDDRCLVVEGAAVVAADGTRLLHEIDLTVRAGELVGIVGASGAGKSTLLALLAGDRRPTTGRVAVGGSAVHRLDPAARRDIGVVPQDDVLHDELPVGRLLTYAARLRLPPGDRGDAVDGAVQRALDRVELAAAADLIVGSLSGGQRKRVSIALELLTDPGVCVLDEPTSGLDPATASTIVRELRSLADDGAAIVLTSHHAADLTDCDRIVALAPGGRLVFDGPPHAAMAATGTLDLDAAHRALTATAADDTWPDLDGHDPTPVVAPAELPTPRSVTATGSRSRRNGPGRFRQWTTLTRRTVETILRNRLTLAIMAGSPAMVVAMFAVLFRPGVFDPESPSPTAAVMIAFWIAFGGFFFGLTYGLLQLCSEIPVIRRERRAGVGAGVQVAAKLAALTPFLLAIDVAMLVVLRWLDRLPAVGASTAVALGVTLALDAVAALALGLLASAAVTSPVQASLALPMLCFPAVLFSGAILPVPVMAPLGRAISAAMPDRWAFEAIGRDLGLRDLFAHGDSELGPALLDEYGSTWTLDHLTAWSVLAAFAVVFAVAAWVVLERRSGATGPAARRAASR